MVASKYTVGFIRLPLGWVQQPFYLPTQTGPSLCLVDWGSISTGGGGDAMAYADFNLKTAVNTFKLTVDRDTDVFSTVEPVEPSEFLRVWLEEFAPVALGVNS